VACTATQILTRLFSSRVAQDERLVDFLGERMPFGPALAAASLMIACKLHERYMMHPIDSCICASLYHLLVHTEACTSPYLIAIFTNVFAHGTEAHHFFFLHICTWSLALCFVLSTLS
jgi:hypothetical protein